MVIESTLFGFVARYKKNEKKRYIILVEIYERKGIKEQGRKRATDDVYVSSTHKTCFTV
jgi:hypothetical protein